MNRFLKELIVYILLTGIIITGLIMIQPAMINRLPNDFSRHKVIINALKDSSIKPSVIFFGNSLSMFGINGNAISKELPERPIVYNLSSVGQSIYEGAYFLSSVPDGVKDVFQCVDYITFTLPNIGVQEGKAMSMALNGYNIDSATKQIVSGTSVVFDQQPWLTSFKARGNLRSSIHSYLRKYLDNETFDTNFHDRYFPHIYLTDRHPAYPNRSLDISYDSLPVSDPTIAIANRIQSYFRSRGIRYHIVLMPINSEVFTLDPGKGADYLRKVRSLSPTLDIIDLSAALQPEEFYDAIHANKKGAAIISYLLASYLRPLYKP